MVSLEHYHERCKEIENTKQEASTECKFNKYHFLYLSHFQIHFLAANTSYTFGFGSKLKADNCNQTKGKKTGDEMEEEDRQKKSETMKKKKEKKRTNKPSE